MPNLGANASRRKWQNMDEQDIQDKRKLALRDGK